MLRELKILRGWFQPRRMAPGPPLSDYERWIRARVKARRTLYPMPGDDLPTIDVLTLVHDVEPRWLEATARSVLAQEYPALKWVILDNGSARADMLGVLDRLASDTRVSLQRSEQNLGITRGHAAGLAHCHGEYVALLEHDDVLYPDALRIMASEIVAHGRTPLLYSDEDKLDEAGHVHCPFFKPDWNPAMLESTGYTCHLKMLRRDLAEELGLFGDPGVEGAADWDVALRVLSAGYRGVHVPEVLYSWRVHPASTAGNVQQAKPYALEGQRRCLENYVARRGLAGQFEVVSNPLYPFVDGHWHLDWTAGELPAVDVIVAGQNRAQKCCAVRQAEYVAYVPAGVLRMDPGWLQAGLALLILHPRAGLVGGRTLNESGKIVQGLPILGMGNPVGTPFPKCCAEEIGYFGFNLTPRHVSALGDVPWVARREALEQAHAIPDMLRGRVNSTSLSLRLRQLGWDLVWTPHVMAWVKEEPSPAVRTKGGKPNETNRLRDPFYSPHLSLDPRCAYSLA
jgi:GT2 family glycosyltransferase